MIQLPKLSTPLFWLSLGMTGYHIALESKPFSDFPVGPVGLPKSAGCAPRPTKDPPLMGKHSQPRSGFALLQYRFSKKINFS